MRYAQPGTEGSVITFKGRYGNYIGSCVGRNLRAGALAGAAENR